MNTTKWAFLLLSFVSPLNTLFLQVFLAQGLAMGIGMGMIYIPTLAAVSNHFPKGRALAMVSKRLLAPELVN